MRRPISITKRRVTAITAGAIAAISIGVAPAYAIQEIGWLDCSFGASYFQVRYHRPPAAGGQRCFADAGEMNINQDWVTGFSSGNNEGWFIYAPGDGSEYRHSFARYESIDGAFGKIYELHIN